MLPIYKLYLNELHISNDLDIIREGAGRYNYCNRLRETIALCRFQNLILPMCCFSSFCISSLKIV